MKGISMSYEMLTAEEKAYRRELQDDRDQESVEQELAYEIVRSAMTLFEEPNLRTLKNAMHFASVFLNDELDEMEDEAEELGLDVWIKKQKEDEEQERLDQEELEREQEELERLHAQWVQCNSDEA